MALNILKDKIDSLTTILSFKIFTPFQTKGNFMFLLGAERILTGEILVDEFDITPEQLDRFKKGYWTHNAGLTPLQEEIIMRGVVDEEWSGLFELIDIEY